MLTNILNQYGRNHNRKIRDEYKRKLTAGKRVEVLSDRGLVSFMDAGDVLFSRDKENLLIEDAYGRTIAVFPRGTYENVNITYENREVEI